MDSIRFDAPYLIIFLCITPSIIYGDTILQRHIRDKESEAAAQSALDKVMADAESLNKEAKADKRKYEDELENVQKSIRKAAARMAQAGAEDVKTDQEWTNMKKELNKGINMIISAYQDYLKFHQSICEKVTDFVEAIIDEYKKELKALERIKSPDSLDDGSNENVKPDREKGKDMHQQLAKILEYMLRRENLFHHQIDSVNDLHTATAGFYRQTVAGPTIHTYVIHQAPVMTNQGFMIQNRQRTLPCGDVSYDNSNAGCAVGLVRLAKQDTGAVCACTI